MGSNIDLHIHTVYSDGTDTAETLFNVLKNYHIDTFAICDHDTVAGCMVLSDFDLWGMNMICGVEFSCITEFGKCHIIGLGIDIYDSYITNVIESAAKLRENKLKYRLNYLKNNYDITFSDAEILELNKLVSVGKAHLARLLIKNGYAKDYDSAMTDFLDFSVKNDKIDAKKAIQAIKSSGGIPVWAHPLGGEGESKLSEADFNRQLSVLTENGICGLECYYSRYNTDDINFLLSAANKYNLLVSGGSDYHGENKNIYPGQLSSENICINQEHLTVLREVI